MTTVKESPLIIILLTSEEKSLVFIVLAILSGSRVTIVIVLYTKLKKQLVIYYINTGLDYKHWPKVCKSWPRIILVSAKAAFSNDFL